MALRVTKDRRKKIISLGFSCQDNEWNDLRSEFKKIIITIYKEMCF
ncbi:hypothetical protein DI383_03255 [Flavobacteriaceae bacterium LYZ1037]|nr:hypothetical protein DI383_03255 [Flavobacteriaceae bacterium LYZ1037]